MYCEEVDDDGYMGVYYAILLLFWIFEDFMIKKLKRA